jgi:hypothetical protein
MVPVTADRVSWRSDPDPRLRVLLRYGTVGLLGGVFLFAYGLFGYVAMSTLLGGGDPNALVALGTLAFVGGPLSLYYLLAAVDVAGVDRLRDALFEVAPAAAELDPGRALLASLVSLAFVVASFRLSPALVAGYVAVLGFGWVALSARYSNGELDAAEGTLSTGTGARRRTFDVSGLSSFRYVDVGDCVVCLLRYDRGGLNNPHVAVFPADDWPAVRDGLARVRDAESDSRPVRPATRAALVAVGVLVLVAAAVAFL